ncbi:MAG: hypothetical protein HQM02_13570 [Magnetococcales bacterium]|nr:hypothetical protein [Magnetococcales bacterium]
MSNSLSVTVPLDEPETGRQQVRRARFLRLIQNVATVLSILGLGWLVPLCKIAVGEPARPQWLEFWRLLIVPLLAIALFLGAWSVLAPQVKTSLGEIPGPMMVGRQLLLLYDDHAAERQREQAFYQRQKERNAQKRAKDGQAETVVRTYTGKPTYLDQILTSLKTVFSGFLLGSLVAIPLGE